MYIYVVEDLLYNTIERLSRNACAMRFNGVISMQLLDFPDIDEASIADENDTSTIRYIIRKELKN